MSILREIRCNKCGKMLAKKNGPIDVEIKCLRCGNLNRVFESMIEQVVITNLEGRILFINSAVEKVTGYSMHEAVGKKPSELWGGHMPKDFYVDMWAEMLEKKGPIKLKITNKNKAGELYDVELLVSPILDTTGEILFFIGIEIAV